jgi:hypothetical protein
MSSIINNISNDDSEEIKNLINIIEENKTKINKLKSKRIKKYFKELILQYEIVGIENIKIKNLTCSHYSEENHDVEFDIIIKTKKNKYLIHVTDIENMEYENTCKRIIITKNDINKEEINLDFIYQDEAYFDKLILKINNNEENINKDEWSSYSVEKSINEYNDFIKIIEEKAIRKKLIKMITKNFALNFYELVKNPICIL